MMASMKVKPGTRLSIAVPSVAELYWIPAYPNICAKKLSKNGSTKTTPVYNFSCKLKIDRIKDYPSRASKKNPLRSEKVSWGRGDLPKIRWIVVVYDWYSKRKGKRKKKKERERENLWKSRQEGRRIREASVLE